MLGQAVCALVAGGGYAEYCIAPAGSCLPVPHGFALAGAAALPETLFTVCHNLFERAWVCEGQKLLVHGGTSGIGTTATAMCGWYGLRIVVTYRNGDKYDPPRAQR